MFISHLKDDRVLQQEILDHPYNFTIQEKIDGSSIIFKYDSVLRDLLVYRKLSKFVVTSLNQVDLKCSGNFSVLSMIAAHSMLCLQVDTDSLIPDKEYYAEFIDELNSVSAVEYKFDSNKLPQVHLFIFDSSVIIEIATRVSSLYQTLPVLGFNLNTYSRVCHVKNVRDIYISKLDSSLPLEKQLLDLVSNNSAFAGPEIEGLVIRRKGSIVPISKIVLNYELFTARRKLNNQYSSVLKSVQKTKLCDTQMAAWMLYNHNQIKHQQGQFSFPQYKRNLEVISQYVNKDE